MSASLLDHILYINLDRRTDRRQQIEGELARLGLSGERVAALDTAPHGAIGCAYSHIAALKLAKARGWPQVLILEDDAEFLVDGHTLRQTLQGIDDRGTIFDVLLLAYNLRHSDRIDDLVGRTERSFTASAYIVQSSYYDRIIGCLEKAFAQLVLTRNPMIYANDVAWFGLQECDMWLYTMRRLVRQRASFSDIQGAPVDYGL